MRAISTSVTAYGAARVVRLGAALALGVVVSAVPARAEVQMTGTWQGALDGGGQQHQQVRFRFNEDAYRLFDYTSPKKV
jgi:hypothetical protein